MVEQKFHHGDVVKLVDEFPSYMNHFDGAGEEAIVIGSYEDQYGGRGGYGEPDYTLLLRDGSTHSWYQESLMTYVRHGEELIDQWKKEREEREQKYRDIDWILENWADIAETTPGVVIDTLSKFVGAGNMWGSHGEAFTYYQNALALRGLLNEALHTGDKEIFLARCEEVKTEYVR